MDLIKSSNLSDWYERLNAIRNKSGINLGNETVEIVSANDVIRIESINSLHNKINSLKSNKYLNHATFTLTDTSGIDNNDIINEEIRDNIDDTLSSLERICANDSTTACITYTNQCKTQTNSTDSQTCKTNSTTNQSYSQCSHGNSTYSRQSSSSCRTTSNATQSACPTCSQVGGYNTGIYSYGGDNTGTSYQHSNSTNSYSTMSQCSDVGYSTSSNLTYNDCSTNTNCITSNSTCSNCSTNSTNNTNTTYSESCSTLSNSTNSQSNSTTSDVTYAVTT